MQAAAAGCASSSWAERGSGGSDAPAGCGAAPSGRPAAACAAIPVGGAWPAEAEDREEVLVEKVGKSGGGVVPGWPEGR